jgi:hypothetical protein
MSIKLNSSGGGSVTIQEPVTASNFTLTLPATTATVATTTGTLTNPTINGFTGDTSVVNIGSGQIYKDASGNVGIGLSNPNAYGSNVNVVSSKSFVAGGASTGYGFYPYYVSATNYAAILGDSSGSITFTTGTSSPTERARIDASGNLLVGVTADPANAGNYGVSFYKVANGYELHSRGNGTGTNYVGVFYNGNGTVGNINTSGSTTSYVTTSDYRLKENVQPMQNALDSISALKPVTYTWKVDGSSGQGFIAHELQEVVPDCVTGEKDAADDEGNPIYQGIDTSFLVATLTAAIQELKAELDATKAEVAALKGAV